MAQLGEHAMRHGPLDSDWAGAGTKRIGTNLVRWIWESSGEQVTLEHDFLTLFVKNQLRVSLALPIIAVLFALTSLNWTGGAVVMAWLIAVLGCQALQLYLCRFYERQGASPARLQEWVGILAASEFFYASCWSLPLFTFWDDGNGLQHIFLIATLMAVVAVRIIIASNFMPVVIAGTGFITVNIVIRCLLEQDGLYVALGAMAVIVEIFFIQLARRLQTTARDMLFFKKQREELITQLREAKEQADAARRKAEEANAAKSRFLATMSHELRTPLNAIMGFSEILSHEMMGPHSVTAYKDYSSDIHHSGNYLLNLINDILDLSRIEAGRRELHEEPLSLEAEGEDCLKFVTFRARERRQTIRSDFDARLPQLIADRRAIRQIWLNLLSNAVKFTPDGGEIVLSVHRRHNGTLSMAVKDNGPGIPPQEIKAALGAFSRGAMASRKAIDGAGLGLPIVNGLTRLHGGELDIKSRPGMGTCITITFPASRVLDGTRAEILGAENVKSPSQRRLIALTA